MDSTTNRKALATAAVLLTVLAWAGLFTIRLTAPSDLMTRDQERVATYVLDIVQNDNWVCQHDVWGNVASKPPLFNWLAAVATAAEGRISRLSFCFPSWFSCLIASLIVVAFTSRAFGIAAGAWAVLAYYFSQLGLRQIMLGRTDTLFQLSICVAALFAYRSWTRGTSWAWFWLFAGVATLTKGPHAVPIAAGGLLAVFWTRRRGDPVEVLARQGHGPGISTFLVLAGGWLLAAYVAVGPSVLDKLFIDELLDHALGVRSHTTLPGERFVRAPLWFVSRLAPMGLIAVYAAWRVVWRPADDPRSRQLERFLLCWVGAGILMMALSSRNRFIHLLPVMPPAAMLTGREVARVLTTRLDPAGQLRWAAVTLVLSLTLSAVYLDIFDAGTPAVRASENVRASARTIEAEWGRRPALEFWDTPAALQAHLDVFVPTLPDGEIGATLRRSEPTFVAVVDLLRFRELAAEQDAGPVYVRFTHELSDEEHIHIVSNTATAAPRSRSRSPEPDASRWQFLVFVALVAGLGVAAARAAWQAILVRDA